MNVLERSKPLNVQIHSKKKFWETKVVIVYFSLLRHTSVHEVKTPSNVLLFEMGKLKMITSFFKYKSLLETFNCKLCLKLYIVFR